MDAKLDPKALAENGDVDMDDREAVQSVTKDMVRDYVVTQDELPPESAGPFAVWLVECDRPECLPEQHTRYVTENLKIAQDENDGRRNRGNA